MSEIALGGPGSAPAPQPGQRRVPPSERSFPYCDWGPVAAMAGAVLALLAGLVLAMPFIIADNPPEGEDLSTWAAVGAQIATGIGFLLIPIALAMRSEAGFRDALAQLGFRSFRLPTALKWWGIGIVAYFGFLAVYVAIAGTPEQDDIADGFGPSWVQVLLIAMLAPFAEEVCFRGMLFGGLRRRLPLWAAALGGAAFFGILHFTTGPSAVPALIAIGVVMSIVYEKTGSIWPAIILHALNNGVALLAG